MDVDSSSSRPAARERSRRAGTAEKLAALIRGADKEDEEEDFLSKRDAEQELVLSDDEEDDESFGSSDEESGEDEVDSDFDEAEPVPEANEGAAPVKVNDDKTKNKNVYKDPALLKAKKEAAEKRKAAKTKTSSKETPKESTDDGTPAKRVYIPVPPRNSDRPSLRASTKKVTAAVVARKKLAEEKNKLRPPKAPKTIKTYTQEELLEESKETMRLNRESLQELMKYEENMKRIELKKRAIDGPKVRFVSSSGKNTLSFTDPKSDPLFTSSSSHDSPSRPFDYPNKRICPISGLPANYFDPVTQTPYADVRAFKILRAYYETEKSKNENHYLNALLGRPSPFSTTLASPTALQSSTVTSSGLRSSAGIDLSSPSSAQSSSVRSTRLHPSNSSDSIVPPPVQTVAKPEITSPTAKRTAPVPTLPKSPPSTTSAAQPAPIAPAKGYTAKLNPPAIASPTSSSGAKVAGTPKTSVPASPSPSAAVPKYTAKLSSPTVKPTSSTPSTAKTTTPIAAKATSSNFTSNTAPTSAPAKVGSNAPKPTSATPKSPPLVTKTTSAATSTAGNAKPSAAKTTSSAEPAASPSKPIAKIATKTTTASPSTAASASPHKVPGGATPTATLAKPSVAAVPSIASSVPASSIQNASSATPTAKVVSTVRTKVVAAKPTLPKPNPAPAVPNTTSPPNLSNQAVSNSSISSTPQQQVVESAKSVAATTSNSDPAPASDSSKMDVDP